VWADSDDPSLRGEVLRALGQISSNRDVLTSRPNTCRRRIRIAHQLGHQTGVAIDLAWLGRVAIAQGRPDEGSCWSGRRPGLTLARPPIATVSSG
jgi:hypothetical protein